VVKKLVFGNNTRMKLKNYEIDWFTPEVITSECNVVVNVDSIESDHFYSALMKKIDAADLKQKVAQTINQFMRRINAKHMMFMFQDLSKTKKWKESLDCCSWQ
jgi:hypothetical protein